MSVAMQNADDVQDGNEKRTGLDLHGSQRYIVAQKPLRAAPNLYS